MCGIPYEGLCECDFSSKLHFGQLDIILLMLEASDNF